MMMMVTSPIVSVLLGGLEGLSVVASPCIFPVLPIILSASVQGGPLRPYGIMVGFIVTFSLFTLTSRWLIELLGIDPLLLRQLSFLLLLLLGVLLLSEKLTTYFNQWVNLVSQWGAEIQQQLYQSSGFGSGLLIGSCIGLVWVPCSGPVLAAVLIQAIQQKTTVISVLTLLAFSAGAGIPMLLIAIGGQQLMKQLNVLKTHGTLIRKITGVIILVTVLLTSQDTWALPDLPIASNNAGGAKPTTISKPKLTNALLQPYTAPEFAGLTQWINSKPLTLSSLKGKVVLVDFWTYSCINCLRTLPYITQWDAKYRKDGLVIIGIHAPEFAFEQRYANVVRATQKYGIQYPVALDNNLATWEQFNNHYWPAHYLIDTTGKVVYTHFGEGHYDVTEKNIQALLGQKKALLVTKTPPVTLFQTPETYLGTARTTQFASPQTLQKKAITAYTYPTQLPIGHWALKGLWQAQPEYVESKAVNAELTLHFAAKKVFLVLGSSTGKPISTDIYFNGKPTGQPLQVNQHQLYKVLTLPALQVGKITIKAKQAGLQAYAFTFEG